MTLHVPFRQNAEEKRQGKELKVVVVVVVRLFIATQNRLVALHSALFLSTHWVDKVVF